jgi:hypothetical protein
MTMVLEPGQTEDALVAHANGACPACGGDLMRWGAARARLVREAGADRRIRPARVRCRACGVTHVVLPPDVLVRRRDAAVVIGRAWVSFVDGRGARLTARELDVPMETARGWLRRLRALARDAFADTRAQADDRARLRHGLVLVTIAAAAAGSRNETEVWRFASHRTQGALLTNTSWLSGLAATAPMS